MKICRVPIVLLLALIGGLLPLAPVVSLELDRGELENAAGADIQFENYEGPVDQIDSREAIREIGRVLGRGVRESGRGDYGGRYTALRVVGDGSGLAADIIELGRGARVDHIENLRRIVSGYLESAWDYSRDDADLLARFATIYNAVNRGAMDLFRERYRPAVVAELVPERAGLAISYRDWPGGTQIVIPIRDDRAPGALDAVAPQQLVDARVIDQLRTRTDLGIEDRKAIIDFIERVIEERTTAIQQERAALDQEQQQIDQRQEQISQELSQEQDQQPATEAQPQPATEQQPQDQQPAAEQQPQDQQPATEQQAQEQPQVQQEPTVEQPPAQDQQPAEPATEQPSTQEQQPQEAASQTQDLQQEQQQLQQREEEITQRQQELNQEEQDVQDLTDRVQELYDETAQDQQATGESTGATELVPFVLRNTGDGFELAVVDFAAATVAGEQTVPLASRDLVSFQGGLVVAHRNSGQLLLLDPTSLAILAEGDTPVVPGARILTVGGSLLTVIPVDGDYFVGEFDGQLVLQRRSAEPVLSETDIVQRNDRILVQGTEGNLRVLQLQGR